MQVTVDTFIQFLKENNVYKKFQDNLLKLRSSTIEKYWETLQDANDAVFGSFSWANASEDFYFWEDISRKWQDILNQEKCAVNYVPVWRYKVVCDVFAPGVTRKEAKQIEAKLKDIHPEITYCFKSGDYINGAIKELVKLEEKGN